MGVRIMDSKTMNLLHKIENKYGSITKCPDDDLDYIKLRKIYPIKQVGNNIDLEEKIISYAEKGYSVSRIADAIHKDTALVREIFTRNRVQQKEVFNFCLRTPNRNTCYVANLRYFVKIAYYRTAANNQTAKKYLEGLGYKVRKCCKMWFLVPDGSYYMTTYMDQPAIKEGIDSYVYEEDCY